MSHTRKLNITVLSKAVRNLNNFFKTSKRFCQGGTDGRCQDELQSDIYGWGISRAHWASRLLSVVPERRSCHVLVSIMLQLHMWGFASYVAFRESALAWVCKWMISSVLHSPSASNLERFKHVATKQWAKCCRVDFQSACSIKGKIKIRSSEDSQDKYTWIPSESFGSLLGLLLDIFTFAASSWEKNNKLSGQNQSNSLHKTPGKEQIKFQTVISIAKPFSSCHSTGNSYSPEFFLFKVPAVTKYTKNYLAASPSSSITV